MRGIIMYYVICNVCICIMYRYVYRDIKVFYCCVYIICMYNVEVIQDFI